MKSARYRSLDLAQLGDVHSAKPIKSIPFNAALAADFATSISLLGSTRAWRKTEAYNKTCVWTSGWLSRAENPEETIGACISGIQSSALHPQVPVRCGAGIDPFHNTTLENNVCLPYASRPDGKQSLSVHR